MSISDELLRKMRRDISHVQFDPETFEALVAAFRAEAARLESQNQALQGRADRAEALIRSWEDLPAKCADYIEMLNDADADKAALQERAERAERERDEWKQTYDICEQRTTETVQQCTAALQERAEKAERERDEARLAWTAANDRLLSLTRAELLSPTQETDPE